MYIHSFKFITGKDYNECEKYNLTVSSIDELESINEKLRYLRLEKSLYQEEVAKIIGVDKTTYNEYEKGVNFYSIDTMKKLATLYEVDMDFLLDDYHRFVYSNQGIKIKKIRKDLGMKQHELANKLNIGVHVLKKAEQEKATLKRKNYQKLVMYYNKYMSNVI